MSIFDNRFKLAAGAEGLGLGCTPEDGVRLAGVKLLRKTASGFEPRHKDEIAALMQLPTELTLAPKGCHPALS
jgi:hypothetical protein